MKVIINEDLCVGCGTCAAIAPELFKMNDEGKAVFIGEVNDETMEVLDRAISMCPTTAISKVEEAAEEKAA